MKSTRGFYIEIGETSGYTQKFPARTYAEQLPDTQISENPIELQEVVYNAAGQGYRKAYSGHVETSLTFRSDTPPTAKLHKHDYFELLYVASEHLEIQIESHRCHFYKGDVCILNHSARHAEHFEPDTALFYLVLSLEYLKSFPRGEGLELSPELKKFFFESAHIPVLQNRDYVVFRRHGKEDPPALDGIMQALRREFQEKQPGYQLFVRGQLCRLFAFLSDPYCYETKCVSLGSDEGYSLALSAKKILDKSNRRVNKQQLAKHLNYSAEYINQVFQKHYGCTISEYNRRVCLCQAALLLRETMLPVHEIIRQLGFTNRTNFYRLFEKEHGCTPAEYRRRNRV